MPPILSPFQVIRIASYVTTEGKIEERTITRKKPDGSFEEEKFTRRSVPTEPLVTIVSLLKGSKLKSDEDKKDE
jgi:hypothetical protein